METRSSAGQLNAGAPLSLALTKKGLEPLMIPEHEKRQQLGLGKRRRRGAGKKHESGLTSAVPAEAASQAKVLRRLSGSELRNQQ